jgi:hypothetical protein
MVSLLVWLFGLMVPAWSLGFNIIVVHDAGESNFMKPVLADLLRGHQSDIRVFALGEPAISLFEEDSVFSEVLVTPDTLGLSTVILDGNDGREQKLSAEDIEKILQAYPADQVDRVIVGMVYEMESQIALAYREQGNRVVGIFDSFGLWSEDSICAKDFTDRSPQPSISEIWLCANQQNVPEFQNLGVKAVLTGSPTLSVWRREASAGDEVQQTRGTLLKEAGRTDTDTDESILVAYAGGYGDASYNMSVSIFCETCAKNADARYQCMFTPHPGYDPSFEAEIFANHGCSESVLIISNELNLTTAQVVAASNASLSQCSTVGGQSIAITVPHAYVSDSCADVFTSAGLIDTVATPSSLLQKLTQDFKDEDFYISPASVEAAGVPLNGEALALKAYET